MHLEKIFDETTKEDNPSNVFVDEEYQYKFPDVVDLKYWSCPPCKFSFGKESNLNDLSNSHHSMSPPVELNDDVQESGSVQKYETTILLNEAKHENTVHSYRNRLPNQRDFESVNFYN
jgi:hypothetical protein